MSELVYLALFLLIGPVVLTISSGLMALAIHRCFGPDLSSRQQALADTFMTVFVRGAKIILGGPLKLLRGDDCPTLPTSSPTPPSDTLTLPHKETKKLPRG